MSDAHTLLEVLQMGIIYETEIGNEAEVQAICHQLEEFSRREPQFAPQVNHILAVFSATPTPAF